MSSYGAINDDTNASVGMKSQIKENEENTKFPQPTVTHSHLIPTAIAFTSFYGYVSIKICLMRMKSTQYLIYINVILLFMFIWSYLTAAMTDPGKMDQQIVPDVLADQTSRWFCKKCKIMKPLRCHHCRRCNRCVMKMDHHCYWIDNCVGLYNMKYFYLTLLYGSAVRSISKKKNLSIILP